MLQLLHTKSCSCCSATYCHEARRIWPHIWVSHLRSLSCTLSCRHKGHADPPFMDLDSWWIRPKVPQTSPDTAVISCKQLRWLCLVFNTYILCRVGPAKENICRAGCTSSNSISRIWGNLKFLPNAGRNPVRYYAHPFSTFIKKSPEYAKSHALRMKWNS